MKQSVLSCCIVRLTSAIGFQEKWAGLAAEIKDDWYAKMKAPQIRKANGDWELVERDVPEPGPGQVLVKIDACGICHSDALVKEGLWPGLQYPRVPGHEAAGRIEAVGDGVAAWKEEQRVGVGWYGRHCFVCEPCRRGDFSMCVRFKTATGGTPSEHVLYSKRREVRGILAVSLLAKRSYHHGG